MKKWIVGLFAIVALMLGASVPAQASTPEWNLRTVAALQAQGYTVKTPAEWNSIKVKGAKAPVDCPNTDKFCLWNGYNWTGTMWALPSSWLQDSDGVTAVNGLSFYGSGINNTSKGWYNRTGLPARLYDNSTCQNAGFTRDLVAGQVAVSYDASSNDWENIFSSVSTTYDAGWYCYNTPGK